MSLLMQSCYVKATDGIKLAIDVMLPKDKPSNAPLPCVLFQARYAKAHCQDRLAMCMQGYAILCGCPSAHSNRVYSKTWLMIKAPAGIQEEYSCAFLSD